MKVEYISHMGDDLMVVNAARVSMDKESSLVQAPPVIGGQDFSYQFMMKPEDVKLIKYLAKHNHWTPFSHPQICLRVTVPIFIANQLKRHVVGLTLNEVSRRYVDTPPEFHVPTGWRKRPDKSIKQGSSDELVSFFGFIGDLHTPEEQYDWLIRQCLDTYNRFIEAGICPEQARMCLPLSMVTSWYWTGSLAAYARICKQRLDAHAQRETQFVAQEIQRIIEPLFPHSWAALIGGQDGV